MVLFLTSILLSSSDWSAVSIGFQFRKLIGYFNKSGMTYVSHGTFTCDVNNDEKCLSNIIERKNQGITFDIE